eukprot:s3058_g3.t1
MFFIPTSRGLSVWREHFKVVPTTTKHLPVPETAADDLPAEDPQDENVSEAGSDITNLGDLDADLGAPAPEEVTYMHVLSGVVHKSARPGFLKCGRKVTANMRLMGSEEAQDNILSAVRGLIENSADGRAFSCH